MFTPNEIGRRIRRVREEVGVPQSALARALGVDLSALEKLEAGSLDPVPGDYILIAARELNRDFRHFISTELDEVEEQTRRVYRALSNPTPADLFSIGRFMEMCSAEASIEDLLEVARNEAPPRYPPRRLAYAKYIEQAEDAAVAERRRLGLDNDPISNVFQLVRSQGCRIFRHALENSDISGLTVMHPLSGISIFVNYVDDLYRQFFSVAHEYAHALFDRDTIKHEGCVVSYRYSEKDLVEIRANRFASHFLLPTSALDNYRRPHNLEELSGLIRDIAMKYRVNTETVVFRLQDAEWISERTAKSFREKKPVTIPRSDKSDPEIPRSLTEAQRERYNLALRSGMSIQLLELLRRALVEGKITFGRFAEVLALTVSDAHGFAHSMGLAL